MFGEARAGAVVVLGPHRQHAGRRRPGSPRRRRRGSRAGAGSRRSRSRCRSRPAVPPSSDGVVEQPALAADPEQRHERARRVGEPQAHVADRRRVDDLEAEPWPAGTSSVCAPAARAPGRTGISAARRRRCTPFVSTVWPSFVRAAASASVWMFGMSPTPNGAARVAVLVDRRGLAERRRGPRGRPAPAAGRRRPRAATGRTSLGVVASGALQTVVSLRTIWFVSAQRRQRPVALQRGLVRVGDEDHPVQALEDLVRGRVVVRVVPEDPGPVTLNL